MGFFGNPSVGDLIVLMGMMKVAISFVKYIPQVFLNWQRKKTTGWSLENVLLDFTGGMLSFMQIFIDWAAAGATSQFTGGLNIAKFLLAVVSIFFDLIFLFQHYVLYNPKRLKAERDSPEDIYEDNLPERSPGNRNPKEKDDSQEEV